MKDIISNDLKLLESEGVWCLTDDDAIRYSDGTMNEIYLKNAVKNAKDVSSDSMELRRKIKNWVSEAHLTYKRSQLLKPFEFDKTIENVMEVGAGCGAITRCLGEMLPTSRVIAVEGSVGRAEIARLRTRDLKNVEVVAAPFQELSIEPKIDLLVSVGVFEYSPAFIESPDPFNDVLDYTYRALSPEGTLVMAIENQFGLKYFAGHFEDHTGTSFEGIEGYPRTGGDRVRTFGKDALTRMLENSGFKKIQFFFPFPDYKIPDAVVSEAALTCDKNLGSLVANYASRTYRRPYKNTLFDEELAWIELGRNRLIPVFANSFLVVASKEKAADRVRAPWDAVTFSTGRKPEFQLMTYFENLDGPDSAVRKVRVHEPRAGARAKYYVDVEGCTKRWEEGVPVSIEIKRALRKRNNQLEKLTRILEKWGCFLERHSDGNGMIDGKYIDAIPRNLIESSSGELIFIDDEWILAESVAIKTLMIRGIYRVIHSDADLLYKLDYLGKKNKRGLLRYLCGALGEPCGWKDIAEFVQLECEMQNIFSGARGAHTTLKTYGTLLLNERMARFAKRILNRVEGHYYITNLRR